ncbi:MAG: hypothetical protein WCC66_06985 [Rhizobiaceae bacterium]
MDYALAIRRNRDQLRQIVLSLFTFAKMRVGGSLFTLPRSTFVAIMLVLRPAESAVRRLIVIVAHGLALKARTPRPFVFLGHRPEDPDSAMPIAFGRSRAFKLFDPLKTFDPESVWDADRPAWESGYDLARAAAAFETADTQLDATRLGLRLNALIRALDNLPRQARRLLRWQSRRDAALKASRPVRLSPIRPGLPPGWRARAIHDIDPVLRECHGLANDLLNAPDTS